MKKLINKIVLTFGICLSAFSLSAQQVNTLYFLENVPVRHYLNPALQPINSFYFGLPILGYTQMGFGNNSFTISSLADTKADIYKSLKSNTLLRTDMQINLLDFGFKTKNAYWSFGLSERIDAQFGIPKDLMKFMFFGTADELNNSFDLKALNINMNAYTEAALGYSRILNDKWTVGAKLKFLYGTANASATFDQFDMDMGIDQWKIKASGEMNVSSPLLIQVGSGFDNFNISTPTDVKDYLKPYGLGSGIDLGATFKPIEALTLGVALTDLGFIRWTKNTNKISYGVDYTFDGVTSVNTQDVVDGIDMDVIADTILSQFENSLTSSTGTNKYTSYTSPKLNLSAEYGFLNNALSVGLLSRTMFQQKAMYEELTASFNIHPVNWFNMALSYSVLNGRASNIGAGIGLRIGFINAFATADFIPLRYESVPYSVLNMDASDFANIPIISGMTGIPVASKTDRVNFAVGFNIVFGNKQDKDKDGVSNRRDKCPDTPKGVMVDKKGCPVDTDGDGVPDYLDKCNDTPAEAYGFINAEGCPIDTDGDGVFDYLDQCPDTPAEARGAVDENGCPKDSDKDGVKDYLDKCPDTPDGVKVDSVGCPLDEDGDGVPDYLDKCPNTPIEAKGMVDKNGCPLDTDGDGVFDYLDLCNNTPVEAYAFIDKNGCPLDSDDDGVADYLDKCPNSPSEARGMVDEKGCPRDTDNDGIPDYMDNCPKIAGVAANKGCPEVKKEVRTLFQKALQGIQFESGKDVIKKTSYVILNQIAKVLNDNPTYLIEVQGHTDNVGGSEMNQALSESRALSVRNYLVDKGVADKRITSKGYGDTIPVASNKTSQGRAKNRRVEFVVTFEEVKFE